MTHSVALVRLNPLQAAWSHRGLIWQLAVRDVLGKYRGSFLGLVWSLFNPLFLLAVYTFVFSHVFPAKWSAASGTAGFALALFVGLILHGFLAECMTRAPTLIVANPGYATKIVFPLEVLACSMVLAAAFHALASLGVFLLGKLVLTGSIPATTLLMPLVFLPLALYALGVAWFLAAIGVYVRDVAQLVGMLVTALLFLSPVFYPLASLPQRLQALSWWNPLTIPIEQARSVLLLGVPPDWRLLTAYAAGSTLVAIFGFVFFQRTRRGFADVL